MAKPKNWQPNSILTKKQKVSSERFEQLLAEVGEVLYRRLRQQASGVKTTGSLNSTEPTALSVFGLDKSTTKKVGA